MAVDWETFQGVHPKDSQTGSSSMTSVVPPFTLPAQDLLLWAVPKGLIYNVRGITPTQDPPPGRTHFILLLLIPRTLLPRTNCPFSLISGLSLL